MDNLSETIEQIKIEWDFLEALFKNFGIKNAELQNVILNIIHASQLEAIKLDHKEITEKVYNSLTFYETMNNVINKHNLKLNKKDGTK